MFFIMVQNDSIPENECFSNGYIRVWVFTAYQLYEVCFRQFHIRFSDVLGIYIIVLPAHIHFSNNISYRH